MRIVGADIPDNKRIEYALPYIFGVGLPMARKILKLAQVDPAKRTRELTPPEANRIREIIEKNHKVEGDLRRDTQQNIKRLIDIKCYRGSRHIKGLPVRGQRTHTNSRTRKGPRKTVGGLARKAPSPT